MAETAELLKYLIAEASDRGITLVKTALVKLLYLADVVAIRQGHSRPSQVKWIFYRYGPYAFEIDALLREMTGREVDETEGISTAGRRYQAYRSTRPEESRLSPEEKGLLNSVLERWGGMELGQLLNYVYFETEPMHVAEWKLPLDFGTVRPSPRRGETLATLLSGRMSQTDIQRLAQLKAAFWANQRSQSQRQVEPAPPPRYDQVFLRGIEASSEDLL